MGANIKTRLMGVETEFALLSLNGRAVGEKLPLTAMRLVERAALGSVSMPGIGGNGIYLANGARLYVDAGGHPEYCTPEVDDPWELVRCVKAGEYSRS